MKKTESDSTLGWVLVGAGATVGLLWLLKPKAPAAVHDVTTTMPVPPSEAPLGFATLGAVSSRFDDLRDIYHMGKVTPEEAINQVDALQRAAVSLMDRGVGDPQAGQTLVADLEDFKSKVEDFITFKQSLEAK